MVTGGGVTGTQPFAGTGRRGHSTLGATGTQHFETHTRGLPSAARLTENRPLRLPFAGSRLRVRPNCQPPGRRWAMGGHTTVVTGTHDFARGDGVTGTQQFETLLPAWQECRRPNPNGTHTRGLPSAARLTGHRTPNTGHRPSRLPNAASREAKLPPEPPQARTTAPSRSRLEPITRRPLSR